MLAACLESVKDCLDLAVINDNSNGKAEANLEAVKNSALYKAGKIKLLTSEFTGFAGARNLCLDYIKSLDNPEAAWILKLDADEVHTPALTPILRELLPQLPPELKNLDAYWLLFVQSFEHFARLERRHNWIFRFNPDLKWEGGVHEKILGISGETLALPYVFFHYGYVGKTSEILAKWQLYQRLGDPNFSGLDKVDDKTIVDKDSKQQIPLKISHPQAAREEIARLKTEQAAAYERFQDLIRREAKNLSAKLNRGLAGLNYKQLLFFRGVQLYQRLWKQKEIRPVLKKIMAACRPYGF